VQEKVQEKVKEYTGPRGTFGDIGVFFRPHPEKVIKGGEDAYAISENKKFMVVADGVGGWNRHGIDPALYSRRLVYLMKRFYEEKSYYPGDTSRLLYHAVVNNKE